MFKLRWDLDSVLASWGVSSAARGPALPVSPVREGPVGRIVREARLIRPREEADPPVYDLQGAVSQQAQVVGASGRGTRRWP